MLAVSRDDGRVYTHDDAEALLRSAVPGARVEVYRRPYSRERSRSYQITVRRHGREDVAVLGSYALPAPAEQLARDARQQVESALAAR